MLDLNSARAFAPFFLSTLPAVFAWKGRESILAVRPECMRTIWYTLAVTESRPTFMSTVAARSKAVGMASSSASRSTLSGLAGACSVHEHFWSAANCTGTSRGGSNMLMADLSASSPAFSQGISAHSSAAACWHSAYSCGMNKGCRHLRVCAHIQCGPCIQERLAGVPWVCSRRAPPRVPLLQVAQGQAESHAQEHERDHHVWLRDAAKSGRLLDLGKPADWCRLKLTGLRTLRKYLTTPSRPGPSKS